LGLAAGEKKLLGISFVGDVSVIDFIFIRGLRSVVEVRKINIFQQLLCFGPTEQSPKPHKQRCFRAYR
jgi:hypothetical protein